MTIPEIIIEWCICCNVDMTICFLSFLGHKFTFLKNHHQTKYRSDCETCKKLSKTKKNYNEIGLFFH